MAVAAHLTELTQLLAADPEAGRLHTQHLRLLALLCERRVPPSVGLAAALLDIGSSVTSRLADRLEEQGYVRRETSPTNRRMSLLFPTDRGRALDKRVKGYVGAARRLTRIAATV